MKTQKSCSRCGGTGAVSRGSVVNGICFKCGGDGKHRPSGLARSRSSRLVQYALIDAAGRHLAINTDRDALENVRSSFSEAVDIQVI